MYTDTMTVSKKLAQAKEVPKTPKRVSKKLVSPEQALPKIKKVSAKAVKKVTVTVPKTRTNKQPVFIETEVPTVVSFRDRTPLRLPPAPSFVLLRQIPQFQLSEKTATTMSLVSRGVGVLIACFGIWFSLFSAQGGLNTLTQTAQLTQLASSTTDLLPVLDCTLLDNYTNTQCANLVDRRPLPIVNVEGNTENLEGTVPVNVIVPYAQQVRMQLIRADDGLVATSYLSMNKTSDTTWAHPFDTRVLDAGTYRVRIVVTNYYGGYDHVSPNRITKLATTPVTTTVSNTIASTTNTIVNPNNLTPTASTTVVSGIRIISVVPNVTQSVDSFILYVRTENADSVALEAIHTATNRTYPIGNAELVATGNWRRTWNSGSLPLGAYRIRAVANRDTDSVSGLFATINKIAAPTAATTTTTLASSTVLNPIVATTTVITELKPPVKINVLAPTPLKGIVGLSVEVAGANSVVLSIQPKNALRFSPLGTAIKSGPATWIYRMDTSIFPDGEYALKAVVQNSFGEYDFVRAGVIFKNIMTVAPTPAETTQIETLKSIAPEPIKTVASAPSSTVATTSTAVPVPRTAVAPTTLITPPPQPPVSIDDTIEKQLALELDKLSVSLRMEDTESIAKITETITALKNSVADDTEGDQNDIATYLDSMIARTKENVERTNTLITERTKQKASEDFDKDLISDYDEVRLYRTNPFVADSDNDGFLDGVEIQSGYDPLDATPEVLVAYESPKETGVVREDILKVKSITAADTGGIVATGTKPVAAALLSGYALPNSFITLYIYSTPIIVTIKTDSDGSWNYRLDKELEDGEHEVYIGVTDNAGKIVAKSARFAFVKRAEAFDGIVVDSPATITTGDDSRLFSSAAINVILGVSTMAIGLILMLFGLNFIGRKTIVVPEPQP